MPGPSSLPSVTRLLLGSDGSTTLLLEALLEEPLIVRVLTQIPATVGELPASARRALAVAESVPLVLRTSELRTAQGHRVSANRVLYPRSGAGWLGGEDTPLGHRLRGRATPQYRELLGSGLAVWDPDTLAVCAFKEYLIRCADGSWFYVYERFNPRDVPITVRELEGIGR
ncbi:hypothetical protein ACFW1A_07645 [Kitasatospora sp. NPDC058965]|uniref:hypothetical protein n=1 Tax=Kitasatospora sp. NPDC058965 TaxID=3346682 RepID=UPI0036B27AEE